MAVAIKTRNMLEGLVRDSSFRWLLGKQSHFSEEFEEMGRSPSGRKNWISELSPVANIIVSRCSNILEVPAAELQQIFNEEASDSLKYELVYAKNFFEYCCFKTLSRSTQIEGYLADEKFRQLTYDMMVAWETPAVSSEPMDDEEVSVGVEAFSRISPAIPLIANPIISENLFEVLSASTGGRLHFFVYDKYIAGLERAIKKFKSHNESSLLSSIRASKGEQILEVDGTVTTQPVLEHVGSSTWPGRLILSDHALYFEALRVVSYDKAKRYDLADDLKQVVKPELTGPWGTKLFDKAVFYKSIKLPEPAIIEFPELKGHARRDYWLAIIREVLYAHRFLNKYSVTGVDRNEALSKAVLGILRIQAIQEVSFTVPLKFESLLMFNLCDQLPGGDLILEALASMSSSRDPSRVNSPKSPHSMYSVSSLSLVSDLGFVFGNNSSSNPNEGGLVLGEIAIGEMTSLEQAVKESRNSYKKVAVAQATVDGVKVDGIDTNMAVMKELLLPLIEVGNWLLSMIYWDDPLKSTIFCLVGSYVIFRYHTDRRRSLYFVWELLRHAIALSFIFMAVFMVLTGYLTRGLPADEVKVTAPPPMNTMEQLLAVQDAISQLETLIQDGNIVLLKARALLMSIYPRASEKFAAALLLTALVVAFLPFKYIMLLFFLDAATRYSPLRRTSTERWMRRLREWWFSIPAARVLLEIEKDDNNKKNK